MQLQSAYLLVSHGSRDPRPQVEVERLAESISDKLGCLQSNSKTSLAQTGFDQMPDCNGLQPLVGTACLELAHLPLHKQIEQFGEYAIAAGFKHLQVIPLFLLPGVHVMVDIPAEVATAQQALGSDLAVEIRPHLGSHPCMARLLANQMIYFDADIWILLSHGSRRQGANQPVEALATQLGAIPAYWSVSPKLEFQVKALAMAGHQQIGILPYFLFAGGITDALAQSVEQIKQEFPTVRFHLADAIGSSAELVDLILDLTKE
ncbi:sirohydrochlorin chelatase [Argonema galeatum]|uniref:sirohydrochlorin chelatase n=1 Tax=Argonema galeatum TaxID=2942762 RepID=UPI0020113892|nr:sirohydrochlorin chelatase [Argonema galeatum]MCL1468354.1 sirohydrochlorin chelatase [Argonema galeatum A003/A1]